MRHAGERNVIVPGKACECMVRGARSALTNEYPLVREPGRVQRVMYCKTTISGRRSVSELARSADSSDSTIGHPCRPFAFAAVASEEPCHLDQDPHGSGNRPRGPHNTVSARAGGVASQRAGSGHRRRSESGSATTLIPTPPACLVTGDPTPDYSIRKLAPPRRLSTPPRHPSHPGLLRTLNRSIRRPPS